jgi:hypothetical protein
LMRTSPKTSQTAPAGHSAEGSITGEHFGLS